jgi:hypothetical protein
MTKGVHSGKQAKKAHRHQNNATPEPIEKKDDSERQTKNTTSDEDYTQNKVEAETIKPPPQVEKQNRRERFLGWASKWSNLLLIVVPGVFNILVLGAILLQAYIYEKQWLSMQASIEETKRNREIEYRAYVVVKGAGLISSQPNSPLGTVTITTFNSGRTPGVGKIRAVLRILKDSPPEDYPVEIGEPPSRIVFAPLVDINTRVSALPTEPVSSPAPEHGKVKHSPVPAPPAPILPADLQPATPDRLEIYVLGYIEYTDIFSKTHWTKFCVYNVPGSDKWTFCPTFNDAN